MKYSNFVNFSLNTFYFGSEGLLGYEPTVLNFKLYRKEKLESQREKRVGDVLSKEMGMKEWLDPQISLHWPKKIPK